MLTVLKMIEPAFRRRLAITAAALAAYCLGTNIPLPGIDPAALAQVANQDPETITHLSVFAIGIMPLLNAMILFEAAKLLLPAIRRWEAATPRNVYRMWYALVGLSLLLAVLQAGGLATALEDIGGLVIEPGHAFRTTAIATLVAGSIVTISLMIVIDTAGTGFGLWWLFLANGLIQLPRTSAVLAVATSSGEYAAGSLLLALAFTALAIAAVVNLVLAARAAPATVHATLWTPIIALTAITPAMFTLGLFATWSLDRATDIALPGSVPWYVALAVVVALVVWLYRRSYAAAGIGFPIPSAPIIASLAAIVIGGALLEQYFAVVQPLGGTQLIIAAVVGASMLIEWRKSAQPEEQAQQSA
ncbi:Preprotein translocase subunit SecY [Hyphomicrobium sp. 1Nfss2.1]|uniref:hypothetical protein n=1 Tax=Hyphomicrobium sp. 1Nfss2.1 TaxID=3413936 RepID=UPI003C7AAB91